MKRVTVVEQLYYYSGDGCQPVTYSGGFSSELETGEQVFVRLMPLTTDWAKLETGWIEECSLLHVTNKSGVLVKLINGIDLPPGESCRFRPEKLAEIEACLDEWPEDGKECRIEVRVYPL